MADAPDARPEAPSDGRTRRSERSRQAIVEALLELVGEGVPTPTAQQVAERADVGIRTVFRHFSDMETLYAELNARLHEELYPLFSEPPPRGSVAERARELARRRAAIFERIAPYKRSSRLHLHRSAFLAEEHRRFVRRLRADLTRWLPELADAPPELVEALDVAASFSTWDRLRVEQRLSQRRALEALEHTVLRLTGELDG